LPAKGSEVLGKASEHELCVGFGFHNPFPLSEIIQAYSILPFAILVLLQEIVDLDLSALGEDARC